LLAAFGEPKYGLDRSPSGEGSPIIGATAAGHACLAICRSWTSRIDRREIMAPSVVVPYDDTLEAAG